MRRSVIALLCSVAFAAVSAPAFAQRTTGAIVGTVTDETGAILPGVTVTIKGDAIVGAQTDVTNERGFYRFAALPPGTYTLTYTLSGFKTLNRPGIKASLGGTAEENVGLKVSTMAEEVTVTGEAAVVDTQSNQVSATYDKDWVRNAPVPRFTFFDLINAAPGVNAATSEAGGSITSSRSTSLGGSSSDNSYQVDGTDLTSPSDGNAWPYPNTDAIEEIEVLSLGAPAEYGNVQGAVFNVVTRQGSNAFHGDVNFYYQNQGITSNNTKNASFTLPDGSTTFADACGTEENPNQRCPFHRDTFNDVTAQIDGPVIKDKLWFFLSYQRQRNGLSVAGTPAEFPTRSEADRVFGKINWQINAKNKLQLAYHDDIYRLPFSTSAVESPSSVAVEHGHNPTPNVTFTSVLSDHTYVEGRFSGFYGHDHGDPVQPGVARVQPRFYDLAAGPGQDVITGGIYTWYDGTISRTGASVKVSHFSDHFMGGSHDLKFGVQYDRGGRDYIHGENDLVYTYGGVPSFGYTISPYHQGGTLRSVGVFVDDTYRLGSRLTLNLGVRYDNSRAGFDSHPVLDKDGNETGQTSNAVSDVFTWNSVAPRLGFSWKVTSDGKTALKAHWGRYYRGIVTSEFEPVSPAVPPRYIFSGTYDDQGNPIDPQLVSDTSNLRIDPKFKNPYTDQFIVGFERELFKDIGLAVNYVYKRGQNYGGWIDTQGQYVPVVYSDTEGIDASGRDIVVQDLVSDPASRLFLLTNPSQMFTRFNGVTIQLTKKMSHNWQALASLVLSKATGRIGSSVGGPADEPAGVANAPGQQPFGQNPNDYINTDGRLISDRPVTGKLQLVYQLPHGFLVGVNYNYQQGRPWARQVFLPQELVGLPTAILAEKITGDRRVANASTLDVRGQKEFALGKGAGLALFCDVLNLTNSDAYENVGSRLGTSPDSFALPTQFILPRRLMVGAKVKF
jgi:outer membrane receptor protein involved in Fe transport